MLKKKILPLIVFFVFILTAWLILKNPPDTKKQVAQPKALTVEVIPLTKAQVQVEIDSFGTVKPRTQSVLFPQVTGQIKRISPSFREGGFFKKGDTLVQLDTRDLAAEVKIAESSLLSAKQRLSEEEARVKQAALDWARLGNKEAAPDLVLRKPQLQAAMANVLSAEAGLEKAKLALERASIKAPFDGRVLSKSVDVGQVVTPSTSLATIYATDYVEVRLPIKNKDLPFLAIEDARRKPNQDKRALPKVTFYSDLVDRQSWQGAVVRAESALDANAQQLFVVAQIDDPYGVNAEGALTLKIGQYVTAVIQGKVINNAFEIPNEAIYQNSYIYLLKKGKLIRTPITITWQNDKKTVVTQGLKAGDKLVTTPLGDVLSGTPANIKQ